MEQPPILGRPTWPASRSEQAEGDGSTTLPDTPPTAPTAPGRESSPADQRRSLRNLVLVTAGIATVVLVVCNGLLLWLYQHSSLGVVVTLATFLAAGALAWLRNRGRQLAAVVLYVQALVLVSGVVGILVGLKAGFFTGVFAAGISLAGLALLSLTGLVYYTGDRSPVATAVSAGTALAVVASMIGAFTYLSWDYYETTYRPPYVKPPERIVYYLVDKGQYYSGGPHTNYPANAQDTFHDYTCPANREEIAAIFDELVEQGQQRLASPENLEETARGMRGDTRTATVTATISVIDDFDGTVISGPDTWTFHLEKAPTDQYWRVCHIDRPT